MQISGRNKIPGKIKDIKLGTVMGEVSVDVGGHEVVAAITRNSIEEMGLKAGDQVTALIKSTSVMIMK